MNMKKLLLTIIAATVCLTAVPSFTASATEICQGTTKKPNAEIKTVTFHANLHCHACEKKVMENISFEKGVKDLKVNMEKHEITVKYDASKTSVEKLSAAIQKLGYKVEVAE